LNPSPIIEAIECAGFDMGEGLGRGWQGQTKARARYAAPLSHKWERDSKLSFKKKPTPP